ncbi:hypothetical protein [Vibrio vulnificus]|uniref:hypothetical protein n=1 Tax=Vibrio vulnificus TaxID=672 RepID=UPI0019D4DDEA|nr:hypothetical protein [Vibrio vulnificus]MBN8107185.1 hypothetical protein [Vibrio vulnificus]
MGKYTIELPIIETDIDYSTVCISMLFIDADSPQELKEGLEQIALYFKREFRYDCTQYSAEAHSNAMKNDSIGLIFYDAAIDETTEAHLGIPLRVLGGGCFKKIGDCEAWCLDWIWIHPYERGKGLLSSHWSEIEEQFGKVLFSNPLSKAMTAFITKQVHI